MVAVVLGVGSVSVFAGTMQSTVGIDHAMATQDYYQDYEGWDEA